LAQLSPSLFGIFFFSFFRATYFSPRRGYPMVLKFCTEFKVTKKIRFGVGKKLGLPIAHWGVLFYYFLLVRMKSPCARARGAFMGIAQLLLNE
jgi:hypothetical protein